VLAPLVRSLAPGERIALVLPTHFTKTPVWAELIHRSSVSWARYLSHDAHLRLVRVLSPGTHQSVLPVRILLFVATGPGRT
jgi:hypothetical protein